MMGIVIKFSTIQLFFQKALLLGLANTRYTDTFYYLLGDVTKISLNKSLNF